MKNGTHTDGDGNRFWYQNNRAHRIDGPAVRYRNGFKVWYQNGQRHRVDGPAIEYAGGANKRWYLFGKRYTKKMHARMVKCLSLL